MIIQQETRLSGTSLDRLIQVRLNAGSTPFQFLTQQLLLVEVVEVLKTIIHQDLMVVLVAVRPLQALPHLVG